MVYLLVFLPSYRQLHRLKKDLIKDIVSEIRGIAVETACAIVAEHEGAWLFEVAEFGKHAPGDIRAGKNVFGKKLFQLDHFLKERERDLQGHTIILDSTDQRSINAVQMRMQNMFVSIPEDSGIWLTSPAARALRDVFRFKKKSGLFQASGHRTGSSAEDAFSSRFCVRPTIVEELSAIIQSPYFKERRNNCILLSGGEDDVLLLSVLEALDRLAQSTENIAWIHSPPAKAGAYPLDPLKKYLADSDLASTGDYLSQSELELWRRHRQTLESEVWCDSLQTDGYLAFSLFLLAFCRRMDERLFPPVWICESPESYHGAAAAICRRAIRQLPERSGLIPIVLSQGEYASSFLSEITHHAISVPTITIDEIEGKLRGLVLPKDPPNREYITRYISHRGTTMLSCFHSIARHLYTHDATDAASAQPTFDYIKTLDVEQTEMLFVALTADYLLNGQLIREALTVCGFKREKTHEVLAFFEKVLLYPGSRFPDAGRILDFLGSLLGRRARELKDLIADYAFKHWKVNKLSGTHGLIQLCIAVDRDSDAAELAEEHIDFLLQSGRYEEAISYLEPLRVSLRTPRARENIGIISLRANVLSRRRAKAREAADSIAMSDLGVEPPLQGRKHLEFARYLYASGSYSESLVEAKEALIYYQDKDGIRESESRTYIALNMLAGGKLSEAEAYFSIAQETITAGDLSQYLVNGAHFAVTLFLRGNLSRAGRIVSEFVRLADQQGCRTWQTYLTFFSARISFELGQYEQCIEQCIQCLLISELYAKAMRPLAGRWLCRALAYSGNPSGAVDRLAVMEKNLETLFFLSESYLFLDEAQKAIKILSESAGVGTATSQGFFPAESMCWDNGFAMIEDRGIVQTESTGGLLPMLSRSFFAYLSGTIDRSDTGLSELARFTREERLSEIDPYNGVYLYYYTAALGEHFAQNNLDKLTALSKAVKFIQERAAVMDDAREKQMYLHKNYWNRMILEEAHASKLL